MAASSNDAVVVLTEDQCWSVLAGSKVGRLATAVGRQPEIFPINFIADGHSLYFRTAEGTKLFSMAVNSNVAFEIDGWDSTGGWSIIARGSATEVESSADIERLEKLPLRPWVPIVKRHWVRVDISEVSGRQFHFGDEPEPDLAPID